MMEDQRAVFLVQVLAKPQARRCSRKQARCRVTEERQT